MENLSISEPPGGGTPRTGAPPLGPAAVAAPPGPPQLPPQMFTTAAQLLDLTDSEVLPPCLPQCHRRVTISPDQSPSFSYPPGTSLRKWGVGNRARTLNPRWRPTLPTTIQTGS